MVDTLLSPPLSQAAIAAINEVLHRRLSSYGFTRAQIRAGEDFDGDPAIFVDASFKLSRKPVNTLAITDASIEVRRRLLELGESRYPYLRNHFAKGQRILGIRQ